MVTKSGDKVFDTPRVPEENPNIFYPGEDDEPMAENDAQRRALIDTSETLIEHFAERTDVYVSADMFIYYEMDNPDRKLAPDVFVSFGVSDHWRGSYFTWREGKAPDFVLEVASPGTWTRDASEKRDIYAAMGVTEYWRFDPNRGEYRVLAI
jgi:Uma2 family endonuclease